MCSLMCLQATGSTMDQTGVGKAGALRWLLLVDGRLPVAGFAWCYEGSLSLLRVAFVIVCVRMISFGRVDNKPDFFRVHAMVNSLCGGKTQFSSEFLKESAVGAAVTALHGENLIVV